MQRCIVCTAEMSEGFVDELTGNTWCDEICLRVEYTAKEQKAAYNPNGGGLYWTTWEDEDLCKRCNGSEQAKGQEYCHECINEMKVSASVVASFSEQLDSEIRRANVQ